MQKSTMPTELKIAIGIALVVTYKIITIIKEMNQGQADGLMIGILLIFMIENVAEGITKWLKENKKKGKIRLKR